MNLPTHPLFAVIIPACDEEACIGAVLEELPQVLDREKFVVAVGVNDSTDRTAEIARSRGALVAETSRRGYGHGCMAAIDLVNRSAPEVRGYIFMAGDGASDPRDIESLVGAYQQGYRFVLGARTSEPGNWRTMHVSHVIANFAVALWSGLLAGRWFIDLAPLRLIDRNLFEAIGPREMTFGWTIESQIAASLLGAAMCEVRASERPRLAGEQKVSGVTWRRTFSVGCQILAAGLRTRLRFRRRQPHQSDTAKALVPQPQRSI